MLVINKVTTMQQQALLWREEGISIGFVPTMGSLHEGHLSLVRRAKAAAQKVVVSIFVNPTQFGPDEDFDAYPRDVQRDSRLLKSEGVDCLFLPAASSMYLAGGTVFVDEDALSAGLCGASRPGHFRGVLTVVCKLFQIVQPTLAVFGRKDAQQAALIQRMVRDLNIPVAIDVAPIVREADGLAMSSRNAYLSEDERSRALSLSRSLCAARTAYEGGERDAATLCRQIGQALRAAGGDIEYVEAVDAVSLGSLEQLRDGAMLAIACRFGKTRLIDNTVLGEQESV